MDTPISPPTITECEAEIARLQRELARTQQELAAANARLTSGAEREIPEFQQAKAALRQSEARARRIFDSNVVGVIYWNLDTQQITDANDVFLQMVGYTRNDLTAGRLNWREMTPPEWRERNEEGVAEIRNARAGRPYEKEYFRKDGGRVPIIIGGALFDDSANEGFSFIVEISEQKRAEAALRESEMLYRTLVTSASAIVWTAEPDGRIFNPSPGWSAYTGQKNDGTIALENADDPIHPDDREPVVQSYIAAIQKRERWDCAYRLWHYDTQRYRHVEVYGVPVFDENGAVRQWVGMVTDVHERTEAMLAQSRMVSELENLNLRLKRAMQETHHRIKNNLQVVSALVEIQEQDEKNLDPAMQRIKLHVGNLAAIHDLLTLQAKEDYDLSHISARKVIGRLIPMLEQTSGGREFNVSVDEFDMPVREASSLALLVSECVSNAIKHSDGIIEISLRVADGDVTLKIRDHGPGFPPGFDPAKNAHTGLELIEHTAHWDLRGAVRFENHPSGGAEVIARFPAVLPQ